MSFENDIKRGKLGELLVMETFASLGYEIEDTSGNPLYFAKDVDFVTADGIKYEVKTDYKFCRTGNFALEAFVYYHRSQEQKNSWLYTSDADFFCFVNPTDTSIFYVAKASDLRAIARRDLKLIETNIDGYKTIGLYLLPYSDYENIFELVDTGGVNKIEQPDTRHQTSQG